MRVSIFIGLLLVALACTFLYQTRNGFFMYVIGHATHFPPDAPADISAAFDDLAAAPSETGGVTLGDVTAARLECAGRLSPAASKPQVAEALRRVNLILLGVGITSQSPIIPPDARRLTELRGDLTRDARPWRAPDLNKREEERLRDVLEMLTDPDNRIFAGLDLAAEFAHLDLRNVIDAMLLSGEELHACVKERKFRG